MLGAIIGDIVGSVYEFNNIRDIHFPLFSSTSNYTDDSVLSVAVADWAMSDQQLSAEQLENKLVEYGRSFPNPLGGYGEMFRVWLFSPEHLLDFKTGKVIGKRCPYHAWSNGAAMRVSALGWLFDSLAATEDAAARSASVTHNHPEGIKGAQAVAAAIYMARTGSSKQEIKQYITERFNYSLNESWDVLHENYSWDSSCQGTVPPALICFLESSDYEDAVRKSIAIGGDSDTIGCITGGIAEAFYQDIPQFMVEHAMNLLPLPLKGILRKLGKTNYKVCYDKYIPDNSCKHQCTPDHIESLKRNEVLVFGADAEGSHQIGMSKWACERFAANVGVNEGLTGQAYAIPMLDKDKETTFASIGKFISFTKSRPQVNFFVTKLHDDFKGFTLKETALMFKDALSIDNIFLPKEYYTILENLLND